jgi:CheY-like chemotaxis protein
MHLPGGSRPVRLGPSPRQEMVQERGGTMNGPLVALVNHDRRLLAVAGELLERGGYRTAAYTLDDDVYGSLSNDQPDLIVIGLTQEQPDAGWQLLTVARLDDRIRGVPFIMCSPDGRMLAERAPRLRTMRCDVLVEPFTATTLLAKVEETFATIVTWRGHEGP